MIESEEKAYGFTRQGLAAIGRNARAAPSPDRCDPPELAPAIDDTVHEAPAQAE